MKQLTILVPNGYQNLSSVVGSYEVFTKANEYYQSIGKDPVFKIQLAGTSRAVKLYGDLFLIKPQLSIAEVQRTNLVIIPALRPDFLKGIKQVEDLKAWLIKMAAQGSEIASICTGAFLLASTGLLKDKSCSTHWFAADIFTKMFPDVNLTIDKIITDEDGVYTNGGAFSFLNLLIYLVEKYYDRKTAVYCSKLFQIDIDRQSQSPFAIFSAQKKHDDDIIKRAQAHIEKNMSSRISTSLLSEKFSVSRRSFDRRFMRATGNTPLEYSQRVKIEAAKKQFESTGKTVNEVMYDVGYSDSKAFRQIFRRITGLSPLDYRNRFNKVRLMVN